MSCKDIKSPIIKCVDIPFPKFEYKSINELDSKLKDFSESKDIYTHGFWYPLPIVKSNEE